MALERHCQGGDLTALRTYCTQEHVTAKQVRMTRAFFLACAGGRLEVARWLQQTFRLTAADAQSDDGAMLIACQNGHLEVARWLQRTFRYTAANMRAANNWALRMACANGHLEVARWLHQTFQLNAADARAVDNFALRGACARGHLEVARWLQQTFQLTSADARGDNHYALRRACEGGRPEVLRWLQRTWGIPPDALAAAASGPLPAPCAAYLNGLRMLRWSPRTHADFPLPTRRLALRLLLVNQRLTREPGEPGALPLLPPELWHHLLSYLPAYQPTTFPAYSFTYLYSWAGGAF